MNVNVKLDPLGHRTATPHITSDTRGSASSPSPSPNSAALGVLLISELKLLRSCIHCIHCTLRDQTLPVNICYL